MGEAEHDVGNSPSRVFLTPEELASADKEQFLQQWCKQDQYINSIESKLSSLQSTTTTQIREWEEKLRQSQSESARRESILLMRLNAKEQEMQDLIVQIQELKASQAANAVSLRSSLLDPAVNLLIQHLRKELDKAKSALEETQNELSAWKFTPDSNTGKRLMAKCRLLYQENEELGRMISSGRLAKLEGDLALQRNFSEEMKKSQSELDEFLLELDEDVEGMQSTIYFLQQQLRQTRDQLTTVQKENELLRSIGSSHSQHPAAATSGSTSKAQENNEMRETPVENRYIQANGTSDHSVNQSCSSPLDAMDHRQGYDKVGPSVKHQHLQQQLQQPDQRSPVSSNQQECNAVHKMQRRESEPDSNNFESGHESAMEGTSAIEEDEDDEEVAEGPEEERIGEADTTGNNNNEVADSDRTGHVVPGSVCQAVPDEGLNPRFSSDPLSHPAPRTSNGSGEGSPDDGAGHSSSSMMEASIPDQPRPDNSLNENSSDLVYNPADSGPGTSTVSPRHRNDRNSTEVGDLVSGSGMEDESDFRTTGSSINGETRASGSGGGSGGGGGGGSSSTLAGPLSAEVSTSDESLRDSESEAVVGGGGPVRRNARDGDENDDDDDENDNDNNRSSAKCRKRTVSQTEADAATTKFCSSGRHRTSNNNQSVSGSEDNNPEAGVSSRSGTSSSGSKGVSLRKRFRPDETVANGEANNDDDQDNNP